MRSRSTLTLACVVLAWPALAQDLSRATPESVGLSSAGLDRATAALQAHIDAGDVAGIVAAVARDGKLVYFEALGQRDLRQRDPMPEDRHLPPVLDDAVHHQHRGHAAVGRGPVRAR